MEVLASTNPETAMSLGVSGVLLYLVLTWVVRVDGVHLRDEPTRWMAMIAITGLHCQIGRLLVLTASTPTLGFTGITMQVTSAGLVGAFGLLYAHRVSGAPELPLFDKALCALSGVVPMVGVLFLRFTGAPIERAVDVWGNHVWSVPVTPPMMIGLTPLLLVANRAVMLIDRARTLTTAERVLSAAPATAYTLAGMTDVLGSGAGWWLSGFFPYAFLVHAIALDMLQRLQISTRLAEAREQAVVLQDQKVILDRALAEANASRQVRLQFVANVSHELRTPVHGILGLSSLLADTPLDTHQRELLNHLSVSGRALRLLIDDILDYAKIDAGKIEVRPAWTDPRRLIGDVLSSVAHAAYQKGLGLECRFGQDVPVEVHLDAQRLRQVLLNVVGNAVKFTERGHVTVRVRLRRTTDTLGVLDCEIRDTGVGMAKDRLPMLFDPFVQGDGADNRPMGGSGLGLAISRDLTRALGGDLSAESEPGKGSAFRVRVPVGLHEEPDLWRLPLDRGARVLVLDWDGLLRFAVEPMLQSCRAEVTWLRSVAEVPESASFDIILDAARALPLDVDALRRRCGARWIACPSLDDHASWPRGIYPDATVYRPIIPERLAEVIRPVEPPDPETEEIQPQRDALEVLVVDDNAVNLLLACRMVEALGHAVHKAKGGAEAVALLDELGVDVILMDCQMPGMDGYEATRQIRARHGNKHRILALTAAVFEQDRAKALEAGMDGLLNKPIDLDRLRAALSPQTEAADGAAAG